MHFWFGQKTVSKLCISGVLWPFTGRCPFQYYEYVKVQRRVACLAVFEWVRDHCDDEAWKPVQAGSDEARALEAVYMDCIHFAWRRKWQHTFWYSLIVSISCAICWPWASQITTCQFSVSMPDQCCSLHPVITGWRLLWHGANTSWPWSITVPLCMDVWLLRMPSSKGLEARSDGSKAGCPSQRSACHNRVPIENDAMLMRSPAPACIAAWPREFAKSFFGGFVLPWKPQN